MDDDWSQEADDAYLAFLCAEHEAELEARSQGEEHSFQGSDQGD